jgi:lysophospholipase L1-like esterase
MPHQKKRKRQQPGRFLNMLILVFIVLIVFEGKLLINIFQKDSLKSQVDSQIHELLADSKTKEPETKVSPETEAPAPMTEPQTEAVPVSAAIVPKQSTSVDDTYFADAVFIGDSRMEGFRNQSGITQGQFLTGVGMNVSNIFTQQYIHMYNEQITVYQALINTNYKKVYVMLGTNDLGEPDFNEFKENYRTCLREMKKLLPEGVIMYVINVAYVEEAKVEDPTYVNNQNIDTVNEKILELCEEEGYHYLNVNEVLSNGNHSLIEGATSDGVHMYADYCKIWLDYLRNHYVSEEASSQTEPSSETETSTETESSSETAPSAL